MTAGQKLIIAFSSGLLAMSLASRMCGTCKSLDKKTPDKQILNHLQMVLKKVENVAQVVLSSRWVHGVWVHSTGFLLVQQTREQNSVGKCGGNVGHGNSGELLQLLAQRLDT